MAKKMAKNDHPMIEFIVHKVTLSDSTTKNASAMVPRGSPGSHLMGSLTGKSEAFTEACWD